MEANERRIGKIESFFKWICDVVIFKTVTYVIAGILTIVAICAVCTIEKETVQDIWTYPAQEYQYLSAEVQKVIVDNSIDMNKITDNNIETSVTYNKKAEDNEWSTCEIEVTRKKTVNATVIKGDNGKLTMNVTHYSKFDHFIVAILITILGICFAYMFFVLVAAIFVAIIYFIVWIMKTIEKIVLNNSCRNKII